MSDHTDAQLLEFLHDLPEGAAAAIEKITLAAADRGAAKTARSGWIRLLIQSAMLGAAIVGALVKYGDVATKADIRSLELQYSAVLTARSSENETRNNRLSAAETNCTTALACCSHQTERIDQFTKPK